ncbi:MAG: hypothetical protein LBG11_10675 [Bifidobacteriaceae bacterium]|jgi:hypothetical protein|nr:hypothetical protein [Bifidobacteriaceae bacterium]
MTKPMSDEELSDWYANTNDGDGPIPDAIIMAEDLAAIAAAIAARDEAQHTIDLALAKARERGATWEMIGQALGVTELGAYRRYAAA